MRRPIRYLKAAAFAVAGSLATAQAALAQEGEQVGENIADLLGGWAEPLFVGIAAIISLVLLLKRDYAAMALFVMAAMVVGGFVFAPQAIAGTVEDIWNGITGA